MQTQSDATEDVFEDDLQPGTQLLHGQYVIEQFLNNGGFGITYLAKDSLHRLVVIKECFPESICSRSNATVRVRSRGKVEAFRTMVDMFVEEARNLARLSHPNIVGVHQVFEDNDTAYMAMDFVEGRDLLEIVESSSAFKPEALEKIVVKLLDAIEFIHSEGILHRDIAPDNILLGHDHEPVLIDFGAARETVSRATRLLGAVRTVKDGYSPHEFYVSDAEQFPSSDLYSLAASLYHVMCKELPVNAQERLSAIAGGDDDPYVSIKTRVTGYSEPFLDAIDQALQLFPKNRIQSAAEWRAMITGEAAPASTRGTVSRPALAFENGEQVEGADAPKAAKPVRPRVVSGKNAPRKARPGSRQSLNMDTVFMSEDQTEVTPKPVSLSSGKGLYMGAAAIALLAVLGGVYLMSGGDDAVATAAKAPVSAPVGADSGSATENAPQTASASGAASQSDAPSAAAASTEVAAANRPAWMSNGESAEPPLTSAGASLTQSASETGSIVQVPTETPAADEAAVEQPVEVAVATPPDVVEPRVTVADTDSSSVLVGKTIQLQMASDPDDPVMLASAEGPIADHIKPGQRLISVNGFPITSLSDFQRVVDATADYSTGDVVEVTLGIEDPASGETFVESVAFPTVQQIMLLNGVHFETVKDGEAWATVVTKGSGQGESDLQPGDRIIALMPTNELIDKEDALSTILMRELQAGATQFNFAVNRDGDMWLVSMSYAASATN